MALWLSGCAVTMDARQVCTVRCDECRGLELECETETDEGLEPYDEIFGPRTDDK